jgi:hypothetical protein
MPRKPLHSRFSREVEYDMKSCIEAVAILGSELKTLYADNPATLKQIVACSKELVSYAERLMFYSAELSARRRLKD